MNIETIPRTSDERTCEAPSISRPRIVVGSDGTWGSEAAVSWAAEQARRLGADLVLVYIGEHLPRQVNADRTASLWADVQALCTSGVRATGVVAPGLPETELVRRSDEADLLVLGFASGERLHHLSYIATYCLTHAACPVVVVPSSLRQREWRR